MNRILGDKIKNIKSKKNDKKIQMNELNECIKWITRFWIRIFYNKQN